MIADFTSIKMMVGKRGQAEAVLIFGSHGWRATAFYKKEPDIYQLGRGEEQLTREQAQVKVKELADEWLKKQRR